MGLLDKLWDDTVAGPPPENGLGRLRKHSTFGSRPNSGKAEGLAVVISGGGSMTSADGEAAAVTAPAVTRSIMIKRPAGCPSPGTTPPPSPSPGKSWTPLASPVEPTTPISPFHGAREWNRFRRKSSSDAFERARPESVAQSSAPYEV